MISYQGGMKHLDAVSLPVKKVKLSYEEKMKKLRARIPFKETNDKRAVLRTKVSNIITQLKLDERTLELEKYALIYRVVVERCQEPAQQVNYYKRNDAVTHDGWRMEAEVVYRLDVRRVVRRFGKCLVRNKVRYYAKIGKEFLALGLYPLPG